MSDVKSFSVFCYVKPNWPKVIWFSLSWLSSITDKYTHAITETECKINLVSFQNYFNPTFNTGQSHQWMLSSLYFCWWSGENKKFQIIPSIYGLCTPWDYVFRSIRAFYQIFGSEIASTLLLIFGLWIQCVSSLPHPTILFRLIVANRYNDNEDYCSRSII